MEMPAAFSGKVRRVGHGGAPGSGDSATRCGVHIQVAKFANTTTASKGGQFDHFPRVFDCPIWTLPRNLPTRRDCHCSNRVSKLSKCPSQGQGLFSVSKLDNCGLYRLDGGWTHENTRPPALVRVGRVGHCGTPGTMPGDYQGS